MNRRISFPRPSPSQRRGQKKLTRIKLYRLLHLDLDINTGRQIELHERVHGLVRRVNDVHQTLMGADFELITARLVDVRGTQNVETLDARGERGTGPRTTAPVRLAVSTISRAD